MAATLGLAAAIITVVKTAFSSCQELDNVCKGVRNAPKHIATISNDLEDFYLVLGTIQSLLDDEELSAGMVQQQQAQSVNLCRVLEDCMSVFKDFNTIIHEYQAHDKDSAPGAWQRLKWTFKESEIKALKKQLVERKITLNLAVATANYYNTHATNASTHPEELERLPEILKQMEDIKAAQLSPATPHETLDRAGLRIDYKFALKRYIDSAASHSGKKTPATPSFQVSALETSSSLLMAEYYTAHTSQTNTGESRRPSAQASTGESRGPSKKCTQILVRNVGLYQTMAFQVAPEYTIEKIKSLVRERTGLENARFQLLYSGSVFHASDKSIGEYGIPHDATLTCTSFIPTTLPLALVIMRVTGTSFRLSAKPNSPVRQIKEMCADRLAIRRPEDIRLVYAGKQLVDHMLLSDYAIGNESVLYLVQWLEDAGTWAEKVLLESSKPQQEELVPPRSSEAKTPTKQVLSFWKAPFGAPWVPTKRVYYGLHRVR